MLEGRQQGHTTYHGLTHRLPHGQRHVGEGSQALGELEQHLDVVLGALAGVLLETLPNRVSNRQTLHEENAHNSKPTPGESKPD